MSALTDARTDLASQLAPALGDVQVFATIPEVVTPPFVTVAPDAPYVDFEAATFTGTRVHLSVGVISDIGTNDVRAAELDDLIVSVLAALFDLSPDYAVLSVEQPGQVVINNQAHLGASIRVLTEVVL